MLWAATETSLSPKAALGGEISTATLCFHPKSFTWFNSASSSQGWGKCSGWLYLPASAP